MLCVRYYPVAHDRSATEDNSDDNGIQVCRSVSGPESENLVIRTDIGYNEKVLYIYRDCDRIESRSIKTEEIEMNWTVTNWMLGWTSWHEVWYRLTYKDAFKKAYIRIGNWQCIGYYVGGVLFCYKPVRKMWNDPHSAEFDPT